MTIVDFISSYSPCPPAREWLATLPADATMADAWAACQGPAWMTWCLDKVGTKRQRVTAGVALVRHTPLADGRVVFDLLTDQRSVEAILTAERWLAGAATDEELAAASAAAAVEASAVELAAASVAAQAAWAAAAWAAAWDAARDAARAAAWAAEARAAAEARVEARSAQPDILRRAVPDLFA